MTVTAVTVHSDLYGDQGCVAEYVGARGIVIRHHLPLATDHYVLVRFGEPDDYDEDAAKGERCGLEIGARVHAGPKPGWYVLIYCARK